MRTYIKTYGCTLNQADSDIMRSLLESEGVETAGGMDGADVVVLNTCTVKRPTEQRILDEIGRLAKGNRRLVVAGCMASANADLVRRRAPGASIVSTQNIHRIADAVRETYDGNRVTYSKNGGIDKLELFSPGSGAIARVPVSEGCLSSCSFCETKFARGTLNSFSEDLIVRAVENSVRKGAMEVQLTSQDMGAYGADRGTNIAELMKRISRIDGDFRVRIGMLNPDHLGKYIDGLIEAFNSDSRFYRFLHLPVQSGSDAVLESMGRRCGTGTFKEYVRKLREQVEGMAIETDIIVGYPTETEADFGKTLDFIGEVRPDVTNISRFGKREHARASRMRQLSAEAVKARSLRLSRAVRALQKSLNSSYVGNSVSALMTESTGKSLNGRTDSYKQVVVPRNGGDGMGIGSHMDLCVYAASCNVLYGRVD